MTRRSPTAAWSSPSSPAKPGDPSPGRHTLSATHERLAYLAGDQRTRPRSSGPVISSRAGPAGERCPAVTLEEPLLSTWGTILPPLVLTRCGWSRAPGRWIGGSTVCFLKNATLTGPEARGSSPVATPRFRVEAIAYCVRALSVRRRRGVCRWNCEARGRRRTASGEGDRRVTPDRLSRVRAWHAPLAAHSVLVAAAASALAFLAATAGWARFSALAAFACSAVALAAGETLFSAPPPTPERSAQVSTASQNGPAARSR